MKLQVTQENLSRALATVGRIASGRNTLPILSNVLLTTVDNRLRIAATNLEVFMTETIGAKVSREGSITVPARLFSDLQLHGHDWFFSGVCGDFSQTRSHHRSRWQEVVLLFRWPDGRNGDNYLFHSVLPVSLPFRTTRVDLRNTLLAHHSDSTDHGDH